jgi:hypothetical protein
MCVHLHEHVVVIWQDESNREKVVLLRLACAVLTLKLAPHSFQVFYHQILARQLVVVAEVVHPLCVI